MATFKKFEDILAWQTARKATKTAYEVNAQSRFSQTLACAIRFSAPASPLWQTSLRDSAGIQTRNSQIF